MATKRRRKKAKKSKRTLYGAARTAHERKLRSDGRTRKRARTRKGSARKSARRKVTRHRKVLHGAALMAHERKLRGGGRSRLSTKRRAGTKRRAKRRGPLHGAALMAHERKLGRRGGLGRSLRRGPVRGHHSPKLSWEEAWRRQGRVHEHHGGVEYVFGPVHAKGSMRAGRISAASLGAAGSRKRRKKAASTKRRRTTTVTTRRRTAPTKRRSSKKHKGLTLLQRENKIAKMTLESIKCKQCRKHGGRTCKACALAAMTGVKRRKAA